MKKIIIPKEVLVTLYTDKLMSATKVSKELNVGVDVIYARLKEYGIPRHPVGFQKGNNAAYIRGFFVWSVEKAGKDSMEVV